MVLYSSDIHTYSQAGMQPFCLLRRSKLVLLSANPPSFETPPAVHQMLKRNRTQATMMHVGYKILLESNHLTYTAAATISGKMGCIA